MENATPMLRQYLDIKKSYPGTILFFRLGDFYEMFNEDAITGARELQITLTARQKDSPNPIPMCGVPHHAAAGYISKLVRKGYRVAICEQAEPAAKGTKLVKREVVRVITPGTAIDDQLNELSEAVYLAAVETDGDTIGAAFLDLSTGEFLATTAHGASAWNDIAGQIERFAPKELLVTAINETVVRKALQLDKLTEPDMFERSDAPPALNGSMPVVSVDEVFTNDEAAALLNEHFRTARLAGFGIEDRHAAIKAAAVCLNYARSTQRSAAEHVTEIRHFEEQDFLILDPVTLSNLEIVRSRSEGAKRTLFSVIDHTQTTMGARLLRSWLVRPSIERREIETRSTAVAELMDSILRDKLSSLLKKVSDLERLVGKLNVGTMSPRDLRALKVSIEQAPLVNAELTSVDSLLLQVLSENIVELPETRSLIDRSINEEPPADLSDGGLIREGFNAELDELRQLAGSVKTSIAAFEQRERDRTGIPTLKVRFNNVFGYYIGVSKAQISKVPDDYTRRQTLANAERYTTSQLKEWEEKVLGAEESIRRLEMDLYREVLETVRAETRNLQASARALATLDALCSLAETAAKRNYVRPHLHDGDALEIVRGRHPVVESLVRDSFVPNDTFLNNSTDRLLVVTGANMGGKSTVLRQIAQIQILAQIGSFVPAASASLPIVDRIWTRVGASDDLASGRSTFMVEMTETAAILHNATPRSLVLLDEIGRGTSTFDGLAIAWSVAEFLHNSPARSAKTVFATHYHELTELADNLPGAKNYRLSAAEKDGDVIFLHKLEPGKASKSYGIAVARLAGLPGTVIDRANEVLKTLEKYELAVFADEKPAGVAAAAARGAASQFSLFAISNECAIDELRSVDVDSISPEQSKELLSELKKKIV
jgi:DNA mismatch repair protein MutS